MIKKTEFFKNIFSGKNEILTLSLGILIYRSEYD
jgi:hypothetical protein